MSGAKDALTIRITPDDKAKAMAIADAEGISPEEAIRKTALEEVARRIRGKRQYYTNNVMLLERIP